jgi:hypothetical protein
MDKVDALAKQLEDHFKVRDRYRLEMVDDMKLLLDYLGLDIKYDPASDKRIIVTAKKQ